MRLIVNWHDTSGEQTEVTYYCLPDDWESAIGDWLEWLAIGGKSKETIRVRRAAVRAAARRLHDTAGPAEVTTDALVASMARRRWSNDHRRAVRTGLVAFFDFCVSRDLCAGNPAAALPQVPESKPHPRPVTDDIYEQLLAAAGPRERLMARLAGEAGLRRAEVAKVHRSDLIEDLDGWSLIVHGKGGKQRIVPITDGLAQAIRSYSSGYSPKGYLFPGKDEGHISPNCTGKLLSALMPPGWSMHKLRHRYASRGYAGTRNIRAVQEALGHASVATTQRYTAVSSSEIRAVSESAA